MSRFFSEKYNDLTPYTPGEQPQDRKYVKLNTNESPFPPSPLAVKLAKEQIENMNLYSDPALGMLLKAGSEFFGVPEDHLIFTNGSDELLNFAVMAFCDGDHPVVFPDVTYSFYPVIAKLNNVPQEIIPLKEDFTVDVDKFIGLNKTIIIANPNAPTGVPLPLSDIERIIQSNPEGVVIVDEAYVDFGGESAIGLVDKYDNLLICQTFSKSRSLAGGRLGMGIAQPELIRDLNTIRCSGNPYNINRMTMAAGAGALTDTAYFHTCCTMIIANRGVLISALELLGFEVLESKANFVFAKSPDIGGMELYRKLKERGVLVRHFETPRLRDYNRITVGSAEQIEVLINTIKDILGEIK